MSFEICEHETFKDICGICHREATITALRAEVEDAQRREACANDLAREWEQHCKTAEAEVERLRAALGQIGRMKLGPDDVMNRTTLLAAIQIARAASDYERAGNRQ